MKKICFVFILIIISAIDLVAQTNEIKRSAIQNSTSGAVSNSNPDGRINRGSGNDLNNLWVLIQLFQYSYQGIVAVFNHQKYLVDTRKEENPRIVSFDLMLNGAKSINYPSYAIIPQIRGNWAMLSSDLRFFYLHEPNVGNYSNLDWQLGMINIISKYNTYLRIGMGFTRDFYLSENFTEFALNTDFKIAQKVSCIIWGRHAPNFGNEKVYRNEFSGQIAITLNDRETGKTQLTAGYLFQNYFQETNIHMITVGLQFCFW